MKVKTLLLGILAIGALGSSVGYYKSVTEKEAQIKSLLQSKSVGNIKVHAGDVSPNGFLTGEYTVKDFSVSSENFKISSSTAILSTENNGHYLVLVNPDYNIRGMHGIADNIVFQTQLELGARSHNINMLFTNAVANLEKGNILDGKDVEFKIQALKDKRKSDVHITIFDKSESVASLYMQVTSMEAMKFFEAKVVAFDLRLKDNTYSDKASYNYTALRSNVTDFISLFKADSYPESTFAGQLLEDFRNGKSSIEIKMQPSIPMRFSDMAELKHSPAMTVFDKLNLSISK